MFTNWVRWWRSAIAPVNEVKVIQARCAVELVANTAFHKVKVRCVLYHHETAECALLKIDASIF